jgi:putative transcriptional regulator
MMDLQGQFLIAMPQLEDYFQNTVVYMCEHNEQGSMGLVINQPTDLSIAELYSKMNFMMKTVLSHKIFRSISFMKMTILS